PRLVFGQDPEASREVHVFGGDLPDLGRPTPCFLERLDELAESSTAGGLQDLLPLVGGQNALAALGWPLLEALQRIRVADALPLRPVKRPLHRDGSAAAARLAPARVCVQPAGDVEGLQLRGVESAPGIAEALKERFVPVVGALVVVAAGPLEEQIRDLRDV